MTTLDTRIWTADLGVGAVLAGLGTGQFNSAYFLGPLIVFAVAGALGGPSAALTTIACFAALCALLGLTIKGVKK